MGRAKRSPPPRDHVTVFVLIRTSDNEDSTTPHYECSAESDVIGVYSSRQLAETAKEVATDGMESHDGESYNRGTDWISVYQIFQQTVLYSVDSLGLDEEDDEGDSE
jgi:hypothetical protein